MTVGYHLGGVGTTKAVAVAGWVDAAGAGNAVLPILPELLRLLMLLRLLLCATCESASRLM